MLWLSAICVFVCPFCAIKVQNRHGKTAGKALRPFRKEANPEWIRNCKTRKNAWSAPSRGFAARVFLAKDADGFIYHRVNSLCEETKTPVTMVDTMQELGKLCAVGVKTAAAAVLK